MYMQEIFGKHNLLLIHKFVLKDIEHLQQELQHKKKRNMVDPFVDQLISMNSSKQFMSGDVCIERPSPGVHSSF